MAGERGVEFGDALVGHCNRTAELVARLDGTGVKLADTRKTTPGLRVLEKYAVRCGGGMNHRRGWTTLRC